MTNNCINTACEMSATCAHAIEYNKVANDQKIISVLNPKSLVFDDEGKCQYYRPLQKVVNAYGFINWMQTLSHSGYQAITKALIEKYNRSDFYAMRNGTKAISPERQQTIIATASTLGYDFPSDAWDMTEEVME